MAKTGKTEVVLNLKVSDGELSLIFDKAKKGFARLSADQKESLKLQEKQDAAAKKYTISKTSEGKAIQRTNAETREENRLSTLSQTNKVKVTKAVEKLTFANSAQNQKVQEHNILSREQNRIINLEINQSIQLKKSKERLSLAQSQVGQETLKNNKLAIEAERIATLNLSRDVQLAKAQENIAFWTSKKGKELAKANLQAKEAAKQAGILAIEEMEAADAAKELSNATKGVAKGFDRMKTTAGLSGAIVTEVGRTISDAPYGIRGMGNNVSQLASLFGMFSVNVKKSGRTMTQGFKQLGASLMGPIGIITGLQILIALVQTKWFQSLFDSKGNVFDGLLNSINKVIDPFATQLRNLNLYVDILQDSTKSIEQQELAHKKLIKQFPEMEHSVKRVGDEFVIATKAVAELRSELEELVLSAAAMDRLKEISKDRLSVYTEEKVNILKVERTFNQRIKELEDLRYKEGDAKGQKVLTEAEKAKVKAHTEELKNLDLTHEQRIKKEAEFNKTLLEISARAKEVSGLGILTFERSGGLHESIADMNIYYEHLRTQVKTSTDLIEEKNAESADEVKILEEFVKLQKEQITLTPKGVPRKIKDFNKKLFNLTAEILGFQDELRETSFRTQQQIIKDEQKSKEESIKLKRDEFKATQQLRLENYIAKQEADKKLKGADVNAIDAAIERAKVKTATMKTEADTEATNAIAAIDKVTKARIANQQELDDFEKLKAGMSIAESGDATNLAMMPEGMAKVDAEAALDQLRYDNKVAAAERELALLTTTDERKREIGTQMALWQDEKRTTDLKNDINVINEKTRIQQEYIGFLSGLGSVLSAIGNKNKEWQKAQLVIEKGAAIANVIVKTNQAIAARTAISTSVAGVDAVLAKKDILKTKITSGISIAAIAAAGISKASSISNSGGGGSSGGGGGAAAAQSVQPPDFNIIGSTGTNQLADAIGSTTQQPIKAYVVSGEVTSAQELDRNIEESASI